MPDTGGLLLVHAHPDDESIGTGATMAKYRALGVPVTLVTCTLGEEGEILVPDVAHLAADAEDKLGEHRQTELADAMKILGVDDWRLLGGPGRYRDSGMMGLASNDNPAAFWRADLLDAASHLVEIIRERRPDVVITYDDFGGYGHPDHIQAHRVTTYAVTLAAVASFRPDLGESWDVPKMYWTAFPRSVVAAGVQALKDMGDTSDFAAMDPDDLPFVVDDSLVTTAIDAGDFVEAKMAALAAHQTQVSVDNGFFALSNNIGSQVFGVEYYRLAKGELGTPRDERGWETDLLAGMT